MTREQAKQFFEALKKFRNIATDEQALEVPNMYPEWGTGLNYQTGDRILYKDILYRVLQDHISQEDWRPDVTANLFAMVLIPDNNQIYDWIQPDSTNPYMIGDKVAHNGKIWVSTVDNNVWEPGIYGWDEVIGG